VLLDPRPTLPSGRFNLLLTTNRQHQLKARGRRGLWPEGAQLMFIPWGDGRRLVGARWSDFMSVRVVRFEYLLSAFALTIFDALGLGLPLAIAIIWIYWCLEALNLI
jgi:hypothetical protein